MGSILSKGNAQLLSDSVFILLYLSIILISFIITTFMYGRYYLYLSFQIGLAVGDIMDMKAMAIIRRLGLQVSVRQLPFTENTKREISRPTALILQKMTRQAKYF